MPQIGDQIAAERRFELSQLRHRKKKSAFRKYQSMWHISQSADTTNSSLTANAQNESAALGNTSGTATTGVNFTKRLPKWLRWNVSKKTTTETKNSQASSKAEAAYSDQPTAEQQGYIGNLGIGGYIETEESTFVTTEEVEESAKIVDAPNKTKSLINLSSVLLWSPGPNEAQDALLTGQLFGKINKVESISISSINNSSVEESPHIWNLSCGQEMRRSRVLSDPQAPSSDCSHPIPGLIKVFFLTNTFVGRELVEGETLRPVVTEANRKPLESIKLIIPLPAWFVHENSPIVPNMTYSLYRTSDYRDALQRSIRWLEHRLYPRHGSRPLTRRRSPSAPRFTTDHRSRRAYVDQMSSSMFTTSLKADQHPSHSTRRPNRSAERDRSNWSPAAECVSGQSSPGLLDRPDLEAMLRVLNEACRLMDLVQVNGATCENSAFVLRNSGLNTSLPSAHQLLLPQIENYPMCKAQTGTELRKIFQENVGLLYKIPMNSADSLVADDIRFSDHTLLLSSNLLLVSDEPITQHEAMTHVRFKYILPLSQTWCHVIHVEPDSSPLATEAIKSSANILTIPSASITWFGKGPNATYDALAMKLTPNSGLQTDSCMQPTDTDQAATRLVWLGYPPANNWLLRFPTESIGDKWISSLQQILSNNQQILEGRSLCVKVLNELTDNQVVYKYHNVFITTTVNELKEKALTSMNIKGYSNCHMLVRYRSNVDEERDILLTGYESPFLIGLSLTLKACGDTASVPSESSVPPSPTRSPGTSVTSSSSSSMFLTSPKSGETRTSKAVDELRDVQSISMDLNTFVHQLPATDPIIPRDQLRVEFVLYPRSSSGTKQGKKLRSGGIVKPSDLKKATPGTANTSRVQKHRGKIREKTKSTLQLNTLSQVSTSDMYALRGARSMDSLNNPTRTGEIFGHIPDELWPEPCIPHSLMSLFVIVYYSGVNVEGIFRRTAVNSHIDAMREKVDENLEVITPNMCPPILAACVLKKFFHEIPGHVLRDENWDEWMEILKLPTTTERVESVHRMIRKLPKANQSLLRLLVYLLSHIRDNEDSNRMSAEALGAVWGPNLIQRPHTAPNPADSKLACRIVECLLEPNMITNALLDSPEVISELRQLFETKWDSLIRANLAGDETLTTGPSSAHSTQQNDSNSTHSDLGRSTVASIQETFTEHVESHEEHSLSSSARLSRSELSSLDDSVYRKHQHSHSSLLSTTTSSSAESQNDSPLLAEHRIYYSPLMNDKRRSNCLPRRKLQIRTEHTLPDLITPPTSDVHSSASSTETPAVREYFPVMNIQRGRKQVSIPYEDNVTTGTKISPPPVPPRAFTNTIRMPENRLNIRESVGQSPPIPPKPKHRTVIPNARRQTVSVHPFVLEELRHSTISDNYPNKVTTQQASSNQLTQHTSKRIIYSRISVADPVSDIPKLSSDASDSNSSDQVKPRPIAFAQTQSPPVAPNPHRVRDRRHSSTDRIRHTPAGDRWSGTQKSPHTSRISPQQMPSLPLTTASAHRASRILAITRNGASEVPYVMAVPMSTVRTEPCTRKSVSLDNPNENKNADPIDKRSRRHNAPQSDPTDCSQVGHSETARLTEHESVHSARMCHSKSTDQFNQTLEAGKKSTAGSVKKLFSTGGQVKRSESETEKDTRAAARCVRRMSSHASTISSGSNTLVSTSNEQIS